MTLRIFAAGEETALEPNVVVVVPENARVELRGVPPNGVEITHHENVRRHVPRDVTDLLDLLDLKSRNGDYAIRISALGQTFNFTLEIEPAHASDEDVQHMLDDLGSVDFRWDAKALVRSNAYQLEEQAQQLVKLWLDLEKALEAIQNKPSERLEETIQEVGIHERYRLNPAALARNVREGRIQEDGSPITHRIFGVRQQASIDTSENAFAVMIAERFCEFRQVLIKAVETERLRLETELDRETEYAKESLSKKKKVKYDALLELVKRIKLSLESLIELIPEGWEQLKSLPTAENNHVRFDPRYAVLPDFLKSLEDIGFDDDSLRRLRQIKSLEKEARRCTWQIYEYWLVKTLYRELGELRFSCVEGFRSLEDERGAMYGLKQGHTILLRHESAEHLEIKLTYDFEQTRNGEHVRPDLLLELHNSKQPKVKIPFTLDAKYKSYSIEHNQQKIRDDFDSASCRYRKAFQGMAFLAHYGKFEAWPARSKVGETQVPLEDDDYNFAGGVVQVVPRLPDKNGKLRPDTRALRRILVAWLVRNGVLGVCFNCGEDLATQQQKDSESVRLSMKSGKLWPEPDFTQNYIPGPENKEFHKLKCRCPTCDAALALNYCSDCGTKRRWTPIPKIFFSTQQAQASDSDKENEYSSREWIDHVEIVVAGEKPGTRCCPHCGSDKVP
jgi:Domain of unknown function (DUF2357)/PD-(D/E)XK nuclease superfamily